MTFIKLLVVVLLCVEVPSIGIGVLIAWAYRAHKRRKAFQEESRGQKYRKVGKYYLVLDPENIGKD